MSNLRRIFIQISRGITDKTAVCVWPWEKPLIEEIHGGNAEVVTIAQMTSKEGVTSSKKLRLNESRRDQDGAAMKPEYAPDLRESLELMCLPSDDDNPMDDPGGEWARMIDKYGMHPDIKMTVVEKVYSNDRLFRQCMKDFAAGRVPDFLAENEGDEEPTAIADMTLQQLRELLTNLGKPFPPKANRDRLMDLATEAQAA